MGIEIHCKDKTCGHKFAVLRLLTKLGDDTLYDPNWNMICCEWCGNYEVERVEKEFSGFASFGKWSAMNDINKTDASMKAAQRLNDKRNKENSDYNNDNKI